MWIILQSQRLPITEKVLTGVPLTREQQQRPYEVHENLEVPETQDPYRRSESQEVGVDNFSTTDSGVATMSSIGISGTETSPTSQNISDLAINRYGFDYSVFDGDNRDGVDADVSNNDDDTNIELDDDENTENVPRVAHTPNREIESPPHRVQLRRSQGVLFKDLKTFPNQ